MEATIDPPNARILVVDDNEDAGRSLVRILTLRGNDVHIAHDGKSAVELAATLQPEVILMDVGMPDMNGYEAVRRIREQRIGIRPVIVAVTGWGREDDRIQSSQAGCDGHLVKPIDLSELDRLLHALLNERR
jgi:CheY-like chemotaxis protein